MHLKQCGLLAVWSISDSASIMPAYPCSLVAAGLACYNNVSSTHPLHTPTLHRHHTPTDTANP